MVEEIGKLDGGHVHSHLGCELWELENEGSKRVVRAEVCETELRDIALAELYTQFAILEKLSSVFKL